MIRFFYFSTWFRHDGVLVAVRNYAGQLTNLNVERAAPLGTRKERPLDQHDYQKKLSSVISPPPAEEGQPTNSRPF